MAAVTDDAAGAPQRRRSTLPVVWTLTRNTAVECFRDRITGLAAEVGFFALLSLPPLFLAVVGTLGYFHGIVGAEHLADIQAAIHRAGLTVLSPDTVRNVLDEPVAQVVKGGRADIVSVGFLISLWSGARAMNVYVDTITIAYDLSGHRGILKTRVISFSLYLAGVLVGVIVLPLLVIGPTVLTHIVQNTFGGATHLVVNLVYWPTVLLLSVAFLTTLYHLSVPVRTPWHRDLPGAVLALAIWLGGSFLLRFYLGATIRGDATYGSLGAPVAVLLWLYVTALAVLIGAELNAEIDKQWPTREKPVRSSSPRRTVAEVTRQTESRR